ncbi:HYC_CC_PP family protein [Sanyastnella coralliicola]|uniref:HYC_CC_PP family protein n=1 Tax=Sanyastnella coralliicola TaxID=3069118 RepID=UPI0027BB19BD|nr:hypothetical protein [Longitalea sp. SCSIO 12813]
MKKVLAIFLSVLMLTSNVGITLATHYCGGKAVKTSIMLGQEDLSCGMTEMEPYCEKHHESPTITSKSCCENQYVRFEIEDDYRSSSIVEIPLQIGFIAAFIIGYINLYFFDASTEAEYLKYSPPLLDLDIPVFIQSFLL